MPAIAPTTPVDPVLARRIRVMIVDDSLVIRRVLSTWLGELPDVQIVAAHINGRRAVDDINNCQPDIVILDIEMPDMDGLTALPLLLQRKPGTVVLVASTLSRRGAEVTLRALTLGAADYLTKPESTEPGSLEQFHVDLVAKIRQLGARKARQDWHPAAATSGAIASRPAPSRRGLRSYSMAPVQAIFIGSSTGGPQAVTRLMTDLGPATGNLPVLIAQHMPPMFTAILAEHVTKASGRTALEGADGVALQPGRVYIAPGGFHMLVARSREAPVIRIADTPPVNFCKPAVDPLFDSAAEVFGSHALGIVLTGMGSDGAKGARRIADAGGSIIAQDEETSVVWGMPGATVALGACADVLPIQEIGARVARLLTGGRA
jgi:two-component system chemotaxis response regulator CheB